MATRRDTPTTSSAVARTVVSLFFVVAAFPFFVIGGILFARAFAHGTLSVGHAAASFLNFLLCAFCVFCAIPGIDRQ